MKEYLYFIRVKSQFAQHTRNLFDTNSGIKTIEEFGCSEEQEGTGALYNDAHHRVQRPHRSHILFIVRCFFLKEADETAFRQLIEQGRNFQVILRVDAYEITNEEIWK